MLEPNGAGKTTLMNIIVGYIEADAGTINLDGEIIAFQNVELRKRIGYVPQEISLYLELNANDNLIIFGKLYELSGNELNKKIDSVLELVQLSQLYLTGRLKHFYRCFGVKHLLPELHPTF